MNQPHKAMESKKILIEVQGTELLDARLIAASRDVSLTKLVRFALTEFVVNHRLDPDVLAFAGEITTRFAPDQPCAEPA